MERGGRRAAVALLAACVLAVAGLSILVIRERVTGAARQGPPISLVIPAPGYGKVIRLDGPRQFTAVRPPEGGKGISAQQAMRIAGRTCPVGNAPHAHILLAYGYYSDDGHAQLPPSGKITTRFSHPEWLVALEGLPGQPGDGAYSELYPTAAALQAEKRQGECVTFIDAATGRDVGGWSRA